MAFHSIKKKKIWIWKALARNTGRIVAWVIGSRSTKTFKKLFEKVKHIKGYFYTDNWESYNAVLPFNRHIIGKQGTIAIEQNNSNTRHYLARMTRKTKVVSKSIKMLDLTLRAYEWLQEEKNYQSLRNMLSIF